MGSSERKEELKKIVERTEILKSLMAAKKQLNIIINKKQRN